MEVVANLAWLRDLKDDVSHTTERLRNDSRDAVCLPSAPSVDSGTTGFMGEWDERRSELAGCLKTIEDLVQAIHDAFEATSDELGECTDG